MTVPVYVPDWQIGDGDIQQPFIGMALSHVLIFRTDDHGAWREHDPEGSRLLGGWESYGKFGQEVTITGRAECLFVHAQQTLGPFPTAIRCEGITLYWEAPAVTEGPVTLTGILDATDYGTAPEGFPEVSGVVDSMELASLPYINTDGGGVNWAPAPGQEQYFRPISQYPGYVPDTDTRTSPHLEITGVVLHLDISAVLGTTAVGTDAASETAGIGAAPTGVCTASGSISTIRLFPDYPTTVLWLHGPVNYTDANLSAALVADMKAWAASYYDSLNAQQAWKSPETVSGFTSTGLDLAQRLANELGGDFEVEFQSYAPRAERQLFRAGTSGVNLAAASAFRAIVAQENQSQAESATNNDTGVGWFAYAPLSGVAFRPEEAP